MVANWACLLYHLSSNLQTKPIHPKNTALFGRLMSTNYATHENTNDSFALHYENIPILSKEYLEHG